LTVAIGLRPIPEKYRAVLSQIEEQDGFANLRTIEAGMTRRSVAELLIYLAELEYVTRQQDPRTRLRWNVYGLTDLGREVLRSGMQSTRPHRGRKDGNNFSMGGGNQAAAPKKVAVTASDCRHHWLIEGVVHQTWRCRECGVVEQHRMKWGF